MFMIQLIPRLPENVVGIISSVQVTASDYETVLVPAIAAKLTKPCKVRTRRQLEPVHFSRIET